MHFDFFFTYLTNRLNIILFCIIFVNVVEELVHLTTLRRFELVTVYV